MSLALHVALMFFEPVFLPDSTEAARISVLNLAKQVMKCEFESIFKCSGFASVFGFEHEAHNNITTLDELHRSILERVKGVSDDELFLYSVALVMSFLQQNVTGPKLSFTACFFLPQPLQHYDAAKTIDKQGQLGYAPTKESVFNRELVKSLSCEGVIPFRLTRSLHLLEFSRFCLKYLLGKKPSDENDRVFIQLWLARANQVVQSLLIEPAMSLFDEIGRLYADVLASLGRLHGELVTNVDVGVDEMMAKVHLEAAIAADSVGLLPDTTQHLKEAQRLQRLTFEMTGALGKRTKYQVDDLAQLVLSADSGTKEHNRDVASTVTSDGHPRNTGNDEHELLLSAIKFATSVDGQSPLVVLDQCLLLAFCFNVQNTNPSDGLTNEQMMPFVERLLIETQSHNWLVYSMGLLTKSRIESLKYKTTERAALQLQSLVDQFDQFGERDDVYKRVKYLFSVAYPTTLSIEREMGRRFLNLGVAASALDIFMKLEMWEDGVRCLMITGQMERAKTLALQIVDDGLGTCSLYILLGDITRDPAYYTTAWTASHKRSPQAMRALARYYLENEDWDNAMLSFEQALAINPTNASMWFSLGCAALRSDCPNNLARAITAFQRTLNLDDDNWEAWNNLGSIYTRTGQYRAALNAYEECFKHNYANWKVWENYLYAAMKCRDYPCIVRSIQRIMEIKGEFADTNMLRGFIDMVVQQPQKHLVNDTILVPQITEILNKITGKTASDPVLWDIVASWYLFLDEDCKYKDCLQKALRTSQKYGWQHDPDTIESVCARANIIASLLSLENTPAAKSSARMMLRSILAKLKDYEETSPDPSNQFILLKQNLALVQS